MSSCPRTATDVSIATVVQRGCDPGRRPAVRAPTLIPRPRIHTLLSRAPGSRLVLVGAPAGSGKTSAVAAWAEGLAGDVIWAPAACSGGAWAALLASLAQLGVDVEQARGRPDQDELLRLGAQLAETSRQVTVVLDGFQVDEPVEALRLDSLLHHARGRLRVVLIARVDPAVLPVRPLANTPLVLDREDLAFSDLEAEELFWALGVAVRGEIVRLVNRRFHGWPVGLQLTARALAGAEPTDAAVENAAHASGIDEFLLSELLDTQAPAVRRFLLSTSVLDELTPATVYGVGGAEAVDILAGLHRMNVLLEPLPDDPEGVRYPPAFRAVLRAQLTYEARIPRPALPPPVIPRQRSRPDAVRQRPVLDVAVPSSKAELVEALTPKELEVLGHLELLHTTEEIADAMFVSVNTVRTHVRHILQKLGVSRRYAAVRRARELGLVAV